MASDIVLASLNRAWVSLLPLNVPMALMGGLALAVWKHVRFTQEVDLLLGLEAGKVTDAVILLEKAGLRAKRKPPVLSLGDLKIVQFLYEPPGACMDIQVDFLLGETAFHKESLRHRISASIP